MTTRTFRLLERTLTLLFAFVVAVATVFNIFLWRNSQQQLDELRKSSQGNLIVTLNRDFFFENRLYKVRKAIESNRPIFRDSRGQFTEQDIDDYIGFFDMLDSLISRRIIDYELVADNFCEYVKEAYENKEIKAYVMRLRKETKDGSDIYGGFEELAQTCSKS